MFSLANEKENLRTYIQYSLLSLLSLNGLEQALQVN